MMRYPRISIIIPARHVDRYLEECIKHCLALRYPDFEIIILLDEKEIVENIKVDDRLRIVVAGNISPWNKRRLGAESATGEYVALIDGDAFPSEKWLEKAVRNFEDEDVIAVLGPAVTPKEDTILQKASGCVFLSSLVGGMYGYRYVQKERRIVHDCHTCNFIVPKGLFLEVARASDVNYWPGEDTKLYLDLTARGGAKGKIVYDPEALVYHHRKKLFIPHLKQMWGYVTTPFILNGRNFFSKILHILPVWLVIGGVTTIILTSLGMINPFITLLLIGIYLFAVLLSSLLACGKSDFKIVPLVFAGIILTHIVYGVGFIKYLTTGRGRNL